MGNSQLDKNKNGIERQRGDTIEEVHVITTIYNNGNKDKDTITTNYIPYRLR